MKERVDLSLILIQRTAGLEDLVPGDWKFWMDPHAPGLSELGAPGKGCGAWP